MTSYTRLPHEDELKVRRFLSQFADVEKYYHPSDYDIIKMGDVVYSFDKDFQIAKTYEVVRLRHHMDSAYITGRDHKVTIKDLSTKREGEMIEPFLFRHSVGLMVDTTSLPKLISYRPVSMAIERLGLGKGPYKHYQPDWVTDSNFEKTFNPFGVKRKTV